MYEVKNKIYKDFDKTQKAAICNYLRALVKKNENSNAQEILKKFTEDEQYYQKQNASRFPFLKEIINENWFLEETLLYLKECKKYYDYKKKQEPIIKAQKEFEKKKRKFLQEVKMSKEIPTKKQLSYYKSLCKRYNIDKKETKDLSKLDLRNMIDEIINEHQKAYEKID